MSLIQTRTPKLHSLSAHSFHPDVQQLIRQAQFLSASAQSSALVIPVPSNHASKFPDPETANHSYAPHCTVLLFPELSAAQASQAAYLLRRTAKRIVPFNVHVDTNSGLQSFGPKGTGTHARWLPIASDPQSSLEKAYRQLLGAVGEEDIEVKTYDNGFSPHVTWAYLPDELTEQQEARLDNMVSSRWEGGFGWTVRQMILQTPGREFVIPLTGMNGPNS